MRAGPHPVDVAIAGFNPDKVLAQTADVVLDLSRRALADRHTAEEVSHPNTDAQSGKHAAQQVARQGAQSDVQNDGKARPCSAGMSSCRWHHTPPLLSRRLLRHGMSSTARPAPGRMRVLLPHIQVQPAREPIP